MIQRSHYLIALSLFTLPLTACVDDPDELSDLELAEVEHAIVGGWITASPEGFVRLDRTGQPSRTGILITHDLLLTHDSVARGWRANQFSVKWGEGVSPPSSSIETRAGRHLNYHDISPTALIQVSGDFVNGAREARTLSRRTAAQLAGLSVTCKAYSGSGSLRRTSLNLGVVNGVLRGAMAPGASHQLEASDVGGGCIDGIELVGIISSVDTHNNVATLIPASGLVDWVGNMTGLAQIRDDARAWSSNVAGPATLSFSAPNGTRMCLNVPWGWVHAQAPVNQFPCQSGDDAKNEQIYLVPIDDTYSKIVFDHSGLCLNVPNASTGAPVDLQQYPCQTVGSNDRWGMALQPTGSGIRFWPRSAQTRSLGGRPGTDGNTPSIPVQQQVTGSPAPSNQRWFLTWKAVR